MTSVCRVPRTSTPIAVVRHPVAIPALALAGLVSGVVGSFGVIGIGYHLDLLSLALVAPALVALALGAIRPNVGVFAYATAALAVDTFMAVGPFESCLQLNAACADGYVRCGAGVAQTCTPLAMVALGLAGISATAATGLLLWRRPPGSWLAPLGVGAAIGVITPPTSQFILAMIVWGLVGD